MPSLYEVIVSWPLVLRPIPLGLIGLVAFGISFFIKSKWIRIAMLLLGLILMVSPMMVLILVQFSNM